MPEVPELPPIPTEHLKGYQEPSTVSEKTDVKTNSNDRDDDNNDVHSFDETANSPQINLHKFQSIDLDEESKEKEEEEKNDVINDTVDEYANIIRDDSEDEEDYKPQSSSRFQPLPTSPEVDRFEPQEQRESFEPAAPAESVIVEDRNDEFEEAEAQSSSFQPFPQEQHLSKIDHKDEETAIHDLPIHEEPHPETTPVILDDSKSASKESISEEHENIPQSDFQPFPEDRDESSLNVPENEDGDFLNQNNRPIGHQSHEEYKDNQADIIPQIQDSEDEDEYIPTSNKFKSAYLEGQPEEIEEPQAIPEEDKDVQNEQIGSTVMDPPEEEEAPEILGEQAAKIQNFPTPQTMAREDVATPHIEEQNQSLQVPSNKQDVDDVSDTDTLHIHDPEEPISPSIEEIRRELSNTSLHDLPRDDSYFKEHAYLGSLINTPEPEDENEVQFQPQDKNVEKSDQQPRTLSQYYSSVNDYFDDYADTSDNENLKVRDSRASLHSSGSLSTGSFSIKSESRYRYSKASDRDSSFNHSASEIQSVIPPDNASTTDSVKDQTTKDASLNPALSINFGQWRPDTDSFRDQFISGTAPPLPTLDNYVRNSMGEIIEDRGSIVEKSRDLDEDSSDVKSKDDHKTKNHDNDKSIDSLGNTLSTSETDNYSSLSEPKNVEESYKTESNSVLPLHIPLGTPDLKEQNQGQYFHEKLMNTETNLPNSQSGGNLNDVTTNPKLNITKISGSKRTNYNLKQISAISDPTKRIESLRNARIEEANLSLGLSEWLLYAKSSESVETYKSNGHNSHVAQAYADASTMSRKHTLTNNVGTFLHKRRVFQDTSSHAQSLAKGIFTRGKKMLKNDN